MKRFISLLLTICLFAALFPVTVSATSAGLAENVLKKVRSRIPDTSIYTDFSSSVSTDNDRTLYHFNWSSNDGGSYKGMYLSALENGIITNFGINDGKEPVKSETPSGFDRITPEIAKKRTHQLIRTLNPDIADKLSLDLLNTVEQFDATNHTFNITHIQSGIPVHGDRGRVTVDINAERITSFSITYTDRISYPSPIGIIDLATAKSVFANDIGLDLYYKVIHDNATKSVKIFPVYSPKSDNIYVDASSGTAKKIIPFFENTFIKNESASDSMAGNGSLGLTPAELKEIQNLKKLLTRNAAEALVRKIKLLNITDDCTLEEFSTRKLSATEELYGHNLVFCRKGEDRDVYIFVDINAETGEVLSFSNFAPTDNTPQATEDEISQLCDDVLKTLAPQKHTEYQLRPNDEDKHYFVFDRYVNGIRVDGNTITIELTPDNNLASYRISYTNADFPICSGIISNQQATQRLFDTLKFSLVYIPQKTKTELKRPDTAYLIYTLEDYNIYLDPYTGNRINADGTLYTVDSPKSEYTDISGHYAEEQIKALRRFGIGFDETEFFPDRACIQKDFITLLSGVFGSKNSVLINSDTKSDDYYKEAERLGIIKPEEVSPNSEVSRIQAAKFICRALGIEKYAQMEKIFNCPFADVTTDKGYVTLLWGMDIVNGTGINTFSPLSNLTRGQTAIMIYNAMNNL